jgi:hypothetical protein
MVGPGLAKLALVRSGSISPEALRSPKALPKPALPATEHVQGEDIPRDSAEVAASKEAAAPAEIKATNDSSDSMKGAKIQ